MNTTLFAINIDYHHTPLGLSSQDIALVQGIGFPIGAILGYFYKLYSIGFLNTYQNRQMVLDELSMYTPLFNLTENEHELELFRDYLYTDKIKELEARVNTCTDLKAYGNAKEYYDYIATLLQSKGKYMDILCKVFVSLNNYILSHSQYYINPITDYAAKTGLPIAMIKPGPINVCGGWIVVEFIKG